MNIAILILALFQVNPEQVQQALDLSVEGYADSALVILNHEFNNSQVKDSAYYQIRYLQAWNLKQKDDRSSLEQAQEILETELQQIPEKFGALSWRMYSMLGNISFYFGNKPKYEEYHIKSFHTAKAISDTTGIMLALRNVYSQSSKIQNDKKMVQSFIIEMKALAKKSTDPNVQFEALLTEAYFENKYGDNKKAISLSLKAKTIGAAAGAGWFEDVQYARASFYLFDQNYQLAETILYELLNSQEVQVSNSAIYKTLARLVILHTFVGNKEEAAEAFSAMNSLPDDLDPEAIRIGLIAEMAYQGFENAYEMDPVFNGVKKQGFDEFIYFIFVLGVLGLALALFISKQVKATPVRPADLGSWKQYRV